METNPNTLEDNSETQVVIDAQANTVCNVCGEEYANPLLTELVSGDHAEEYYACPRCLTKVGEVERQDRLEVDEAGGEEAEESADVQAEHEPVKPADAPGCPYYLGYLKKRQKNSPIPENCFTCTKMIECTR